MRATIHVIIKGTIAQAARAAADRGIGLAIDRVWQRLGAQGECVGRVGGQHESAIRAWFHEAPNDPPFPPGTLLHFSTREPYRVVVAARHTEPGMLSCLTGEKLVWEHRTLKAAKRRLGSAISGKLARQCAKLSNPTYYIVTPDNQRLTWTDARNLIEGGAP